MVKATREKNIPRKAEGDQIQSKLLKKAYASIAGSIGTEDTESLGISDVGIIYKPETKVRTCHSPIT